MRNIFLLISLVILMVSCNTVTEEKRENYDFGTKQFDEPFYYLPSKPAFLVESLQYTPSWFLTDTIYLTKTIEIEFNEESIRSQSTAIIKVGDSLGNTIPGIQVYFNSLRVSDNLMEVVASGEEKQEITIGLKLLPEYGEQTFKGGIFLLSDDLDEFNGATVTYDLNQVADWQAGQKIGGTWMLWLVWFLILLILIFVLYKILYLLSSLLIGGKSSISSVPPSQYKSIRQITNVKNKEKKNTNKKEVIKEEQIKIEQIPKLDPNRPYRREEIDFVFKRVKEKLHQEAKERGGGEQTIFEDCYTGLTIRGGEPYDYEHIRSAESIFMEYRDRLSNEEIAQVVNCEENVKVTLRSINQSKGKYAFERWCTNERVMTYGINLKRAKTAVKLADKGILRTAKKFV